VVLVDQARTGLEGNRGRGGCASRQARLLGLLRRERPHLCEHGARFAPAGHRSKGRSVTFTFEADGFLYKMVRSLTGALVSVGLGKLAVIEVAELIKTRRRIPSVVTAPPQGLFLVKVIY
jgi:hypothetical protein